MIQEYDEQRSEHVIRIGLVDFEPGTSLLDHIGLFRDLEPLLGIGVQVVARSALKPRDNCIRDEAVDL